MANTKAFERPRSTKSVQIGNCFVDGCPGGESSDQIGARADRVLARVRLINESVLLVSSGHFLRVLAARWLGLDVGGGAFFVLETASLSILGCEHNLSEPAFPHLRRC
jgi:broad specificity phosphatase PhoE